MESKRPTSSAEILHFNCKNCRISLTVDESLAGVTGPCPSCGAENTAPDRKSREKAREEAIEKLESKIDREQDRRVKSDQIRRRPRKNLKRRKHLKTLIIAIIIVAITFGVYYWWKNRTVEKTGQSRASIPALFEVLKKPSDFRETTLLSS